MFSLWLLPTQCTIILKWVLVQPHACILISLLYMNAQSENIQKIAVYVQVFSQFYENTLRMMICEYPYIVQTPYFVVVQEYKQLYNYIRWSEACVPKKRTKEYPCSHYVNVKKMTNKQTNKEKMDTKYFYCIYHARRRHSFGQHTNFVWQQFSRPLLHNLCKMCRIYAVQINYEYVQHLMYRFEKPSKAKRFYFVCKCCCFLLVPLQWQLITVTIR